MKSSLASYLVELGKRVWFLIPALLLDPLDLFNALNLGIDLPQSVFYLGLTAAVVAAGFFAFDSEYSERRRLEELNKPKLRLTLDDTRDSPDNLRRFVRLKVDNVGRTPIEGCQGKLLEVVPNRPTNLPEPGQNLMWSSRGGDVSRSPQARRNIDGMSHEYLDVAFTDNFVERIADGSLEVTPYVRQRYQELKNAPFPHFFFVFADYNAWPVAEGEYEVTIQVSGSNAGEPVVTKIRITYANYLNLSARQVSIS